ncbi:hypothetical protein R1sor_008227 [Riccia sorocarpa]|uniref:Uncharacterized protein n=1 Tax=Riccia sorocarpa TaxID=122646 RepID=A0ABD3HUF6_9MARC
MRLRKKTAEIRCSEESKTPNRTSNWNWKDFVKDTNWFATMCNLPSPPGGLIPVEIPETLISMEKLTQCFTRGPRWFRVNPSRIIPVAELKELVEILEGPAIAKRNRLNIPVAKGIYAERILGLSVNWALYAHHKHKVLLQRAWSSGRPPPRGPPLLRVPIWYNRPPPLNLNAIDGFALKETPPADAATGCGTSIEVIECNLSPKVAYSCSSLNSDAAADIQRCSDPVERRDPSLNHEPDHTPGVNSEHTAHAENFKTEAPRQNTENLRTEALAGTTYNQSLISMLTPERLQLEILSLTRQQQKLQDDISILRSILEMVSRKGQNTENLRTEAPTGTAYNQSLISMLTPERIQLEILSLTRQQQKLQDDISILRSILEMVSRKGCEDLVTVNMVCRL